MNTTVFYKKISILTGCLLIFIAVLSQFSPFQDTIFFSLGVTLLFVIFTIAIYHLGDRSANSSDKNSFMVLAISSIFIKLVLSLFLIVSYQVIAQPPSKLYLLPFLLIYLTYTVFETMIMMVLAKSNQTNKD